MAHDEAVVGKAGQKTRKYPGVVGFGVECIGSGKGGIDGDAFPFRLATEAHAQNVEGQSFAITQAPPRTSAAALTHPRARGVFGDNIKERIAYLRKQLHVLVAVKEIRDAAEGINKGA